MTDTFRTPANLKARCKRLYGVHWRKGVTRDLCIPSSTLGNYIDGSAKIPEWFHRVMEIIEAQSRCTCGACSWKRDVG